MKIFLALVVLFVCSSHTWCQVQVSGDGDGDGQVSGDEDGECDGCSSDEVCLAGECVTCSFKFRSSCYNLVLDKLTADEAAIIYIRALRYQNQKQTY